MGSRSSCPNKVIYLGDERFDCVYLANARGLSLKHTSWRSVVRYENRIAIPLHVVFIPQQYQASTSQSQAWKRTELELVI